MMFREGAQLAHARHHALGDGNVHVRPADTYWGWPEAAPFDSILGLPRFGGQATARAT